jgi:hypothetical protein
LSGGPRVQPERYARLRWRLHGSVAVCCCWRPHSSVCLLCKHTGRHLPATLVKKWEERQVKNSVFLPLILGWFPTVSVAQESSRCGTIRDDIVMKATSGSLSFIPEALESFQTLQCKSSYDGGEEPSQCGPLRKQVTYLHTHARGERAGPIVVAMGRIACKMNYTVDPEPAECADFRRYVGFLESVNRASEIGPVIDAMSTVGCRP